MTRKKPWLLTLVFGFALGVVGFWPKPAWSLDQGTVDLIKERLLRPDYSFASLKAILVGLRSPGHDLRFFAIQAGLEFPELRSEVLAQALGDGRPEIVNLGLAWLDKDFQAGFAEDLIRLVRRSDSIGFGALSILTREAPQRLALDFEALFLNGGPGLRQALLAEVFSGRLGREPGDLLRLAGLMGQADRFKLLTYLSANGKASTFARGFAEWDLEDQRGFLIYLKSKPGLAQEPELARLLENCQTPDLEADFSEVLTAADNPGMREILAERLLAATDLTTAKDLALELKRFSRVKVGVLNYAAGVVLLDDYLSSRRRREVAQNQRLAGVVGLLSDLRAESELGAVNKVKSLQHEAREFKRLQEEESGHRERLETYLKKPSSKRLKERFGGVLEHYAGYRL